ncbi:MAG TPA: transcription antitermination factor NusB [Candidatus Kapabacteria bacterium]|nr:transcription antitermination factor NusB [Candidatus Kapabacteria bacterium]
MPTHATPPDPYNKRPFVPRLHVEAPQQPRIEADELFENDPIRDRDLPKRRLARERVLQILYAHALGGGDLDQLFAELAEPDLSEADKRAGKKTVDSEDAGGALDFAKDLTRELVAHREAISLIISERLERWDIQRVALIDRLLMEIGIVELLYFPEIPPKATINELIEIAKDFSTEESGKFINGLLHAVMTHLMKTGEIKKSGRGLLEESLNGYRPAKGRAKPKE